jgi:hypothetical protein
MTRLVLGLARAVEPPLRFLLGGLFALVAALLGALRALPEAGYPFPGRLAYQAPPLEVLLVGFLLVGALVACRWVGVPRGPAAALSVLLLGLAGAAVTEALVPTQGLARVAALTVVALLALRWSKADDRAEVLRGGAFLAFGLVVVKYVVLEGFASGGDASAVNLTLRAATAGLLTQPMLPAGDEYRAALVLLAFAASVASQVAPAPEVPAPAPPPMLPKPADPPLQLEAGEDAPAALPPPVDT